ncbi:PP2C family protein-serine/threonine phosphatase [Streptomyces sp. NPDC051452]|uniref:PP2C family protein-serine/threonine phosphatase n=1 Tax=Streptomyces sp. NPDC051452 TaxID=3365654 RepID=UPI0037ABC491
MLADLLAASHLMPLEALPREANAYAAAAGLREVRIYLADLRHTVLRLLTGSGPDAAEGARGDAAELVVDATLAGRAYRFGRIVPAAAGPDGHGWWVPLLDGTERLGALHIVTATDDERTADDMQALASLLALIIVSKRDHSDSYARLVRSAPMGVAAEMQWSLTAPRTYADGRVVVSAVMEPAYRISGDAFDYATDGHVVHLSVFDAMGHDTAAGLTANLAMAACRNARRQGAGLVEVTETIEQVLTEQFADSSYATGVLADLDTATGLLTWVNRGHVPPLLIRGGRWATRLGCPPAHPMGTRLGLPVSLCREQLEPGDRLVLYTDGITEARRAGTEFGLDRFVDFLVRHHADGLPVPETLRRLTRAVVDHHDGYLQDDATVLLCEWLGPTPTNRRAAAETGIAEHHRTPRPLGRTAGPPA